MTTKNIWLRHYRIKDWNGRESSDRHDRLISTNKRFLLHRVNIPFKIIEISHYLEISDWCDSNFKQRFCLWDHHVNCLNEEDAFAFKMRWS